MQIQHHTNSYYAAKVNDHADLTPKRRRLCHRAGFTGIYTALYLAERGYKVHVLEANKVGWGASGRNGSQMIGGISGEHQLNNYYGPDVEKMFWEMRWAGHEIIRKHVNTYSIQCDLKFGYLDVAIKKDTCKTCYQPSRK
jgi:gamma-glutamylputrescine oxidase